MRRLELSAVLLTVAVAVSACADEPVRPAAPPTEATFSRAAAPMGINVLLNRPATAEILADLATYGTITRRIDEIGALTLRSTSDRLSALQAEAYVAAASPDAERKGAPVDPIAIGDFSGGISTWNLDAVNVTNLAAGRTIAFDGRGVYVGVLDTGLLDTWRQYFPEERIARQYAKSFGGGGGESGLVSEQPNKWEQDTNSHGTHVTSTILGYRFAGAAGTLPVNGVAPMATVIPVKVLNQSGSGWSSVVAEGIVYIAGLKAGPLAASPVVINMSLGGASLDAVEKAAIDYAISRGVIIVAAAGNEGVAGMSYPGAYAPVISAAAAGWIREFTVASWWRTLDFPDPTRASELYIADFSSRAKAGQDLDVSAPGSNVVGPYQLQSGQTSYFYLSGTSMASPHVAGIVALMMQKQSTLTAAQAESILESTAIPMRGWSAAETGSGFATADAALGKL